MSFVNLNNNNVSVRGSSLAPGSQMVSCNVQSTPCRFFKNGSCSYGDACPFSHSVCPGEVPSPHPQTICKYFLKGTCRFGTACALSHNMPKRPPGVNVTSFPHSPSVPSYYSVPNVDDDSDSLEFKELLDELDNLSMSTTLPADPPVAQTTPADGVLREKNSKIARLWEPVDIPPHPSPACNISHSQQSGASFSAGSTLDAAFSPGSGAEFLRQSRRLSVASTSNGHSAFSRLPAASARIASSSPDSIAGRAAAFFPSLCPSEEELSEEASFFVQQQPLSAGDVSFDTQFSLDLDGQSNNDTQRGLLWQQSSAASSRYMLPSASSGQSLSSYSGSSLNASQTMHASSSVSMLPFKLDTVRQDSGLDLGINTLAQQSQSHYSPNLNRPSPFYQATSNANSNGAAPNQFTRRSNVGNPNMLCPFAINGTCRFNQSCRYVHGLPCPNCKRNILHPDPAVRAQEPVPHVLHCKANMIAAQKRNQMQIQLFLQLLQNQAKSPAASNPRSNPASIIEQLECGLCYEKIGLKKDCRFGILNCDHVFCLSCIRQWRSNFYMDNQVTRSCPVCRVVTHFVTPANKWPLFKEEKECIISDYKLKISQVPCKYYNFGASICPFGASCFYSHEIPPNLVINSSLQQNPLKSSTVKY